MSYELSLGGATGEKVEEVMCGFKASGRFTAAIDGGPGKPLKGFVRGWTTDTGLLAVEFCEGAVTNKRWIPTRQTLWKMLRRRLGL